MVSELMVYFIGYLTATLDMIGYCLAEYVLGIITMIPICIWLYTKSKKE